MNKLLTLGSLFDGSGGFPLGGLLCGVVPLWSSEVEPFPIRVTTKRMPQVQHYGDINKINGAAVPPVDIITGGFCCQDLSVAGKRAGLHGERSGLFFQITRIIKEMLEATNGEYPKYAVLENVPGMYSSGGGTDFLEVLNELIKIKDETLSVPLPEKRTGGSSGKWSTSGEIVGDGFSIGWRTFDAQFWGVAQRRRRCYIVIDLTGERAGKILFDESRLRGNPPQSFGAWKTTAGTSAAGAGGAGVQRQQVVVLNDQGGSCMDVSEDITGTLRAQEHGHQPIVFEPGAMLRLGGHCWEGEPTGALRADMGDNRFTVAIPINTQVATRHISLGEGTGFGVGDDGDPAYTIQAGHSHAVAVENHPSDSRLKINEDGIVQTLDARMGMGGGNVPLVCEPTAAAFMGGQGADAGGISYSKDVFPTIRAQAGGNSVPMVMCEPKTLKIRSGCEGGGKGALIQDNLSATLSTSNDQTVFVPTAYGISSYESNAMKSDNPNSGVYEAETARTLDANGGNPGCNQGGIAVVFEGKQVTSKANRSNPQPGNPCHTLASGSADSAYCIQGNMIGRKDENGPQGDGVNEDISFTLTGQDQHGVAYAMTTGSYMQINEETAPTLQARDYKDPPAVNQIAVENHQHSGYRETDIAGTLKTSGGTNGGGSENMVIENRYIVRRLTPTECALLQGFPPNWCAGLETPEPTEEDITFWSEVWEMHRLIIGKSSKPKSRSQIVKWLKDPHSDAAEYKMWGNGVALPCVFFVLSGIVYYTQSEGL